MRALYTEIESRLEKIDFDKIFPKFHPFPFALYDDTRIWFRDGEVLRTEEFYGNTVIEYEGQLIAIWYLPKVEADIDKDILAASVVHEMFHGFQKEVGLVKDYPNDLKILQYPQDITNYNAKYNENRLISEAITTSVEEKKILYRMIQSSRELRKQGIGDFLKQELFVEELEGRAECCGLLALKQLEENKYNQKIKEYVSILKNEYETLFDIRRVSYFSGALLKLIEKEIQEEKCIIETILTEVNKKKEKRIADFFKEERTYHAIDTYICGYDPMNQFRVQNQIFAENMIFLMIEGNPEKINGPVVICMKEDSHNLISGYYI